MNFLASTVLYRFWLGHACLSKKEKPEAKMGLRKAKNAEMTTVHGNYSDHI